MAMHPIQVTFHPQYSGPDGTPLHSAPVDGQIFVEFYQGTNKAHRTWQWRTRPTVFGRLSDWELIGENTDPNFALEPHREEIKCECGSESVGSPKHSTWCKKFNHTT
jgi:hypothetical protein